MIHGHIQNSLSTNTITFTSKALITDNVIDSTVEAATAKLSK